MQLLRTFLPNTNMKKSLNGKRRRRAANVCVSFMWGTIEKELSNLHESMNPSLAMTDSFSLPGSEPLKLIAGLDWLRGHVTNFARVLASQYLYFCCPSFFLYPAMYIPDMRIAKNIGTETETEKPVYDYEAPKCIPLLRPPLSSAGRGGEAGGMTVFSKTDPDVCK